MLMAHALTVLAAATESEGGVDPIWWGLGAFAILVSLLLITVGLGRGRN